MNESVKTRNIGKLFEASFCIVYLLYIAVATIIFFLNATKAPAVLLFAYLSLILGAGDAFHLVPRILIAFKGESPKLQWNSGLGLMVSSITMTIFYIILFYIWKTLFPDIAVSPIVGSLLWITAVLRIVLCLFPQNNWFSHEGNLKWGIYRNLPFIVTGFCDFYLFTLVSSGPYGHFWMMSPAILISFACYLPVVLFSKKYPAVGMLMIPKTIAYMFMIGLGLFYVYS